MRRKYQKDPTSVTASDWTRAVEGQERKLQFIYGKKFKREKWPKGVPYLNMIAAAEHQTKKGEASLRRIKTAQIKTAAKPQPRALRTTSTESRDTALSTPFPPSGIEHQIRVLEHANMQTEKQLVLLRKSRADPASVSYKQWLDATDRTDALVKDAQIVGLVELARRRARGEECDGWAFGRYHGP
jgi:primosomal replication protein N